MSNGKEIKYMCSNEKFYKAGEAADFIGVSLQTLRNWQERGVLIPDKVLESGHRLYSESQLEDFIKKQEVH